MTRVMGIDLGIKKVAYALWEDGPRGGNQQLLGAEAYESHAPDRPTQLMDLGDFIYEAAHHTHLDYVFIEDTLIGNNRKYSIQLAQTMGSVLSSLALLRAEAGVEIFTVNVSTWKKQVVGNGNAAKTLVKNHIDVVHSAYAVLCEGDQDRYDAACIGLYGLSVHDRARVLTAAPSRTAS